MGADAAADGRQVLQVYVSRLRKELGDGRLLTRPPGYVLQVTAPSSTSRASSSSSTSRGDPIPAAPQRPCGERWRLWRGPALADLAYESFAQPEIARLEELRWAAHEQRIDADLAAGRTRS